MREISPPPLTGPNPPGPPMNGLQHDPRWSPGPPPEDGWNILRKLWRRKWLAASVTVVFLAAGIAAAAMMTPRYTATARLLIGVQDPHVADIEAVLKNVLPDTETTRSEAYLIASRGMARQVGYRLALDKSAEFNPALEPKDEWWRPYTPSNLAKEAKAYLGLDGKPTAPRETQAVPGTEPRSPEERLWEGIEARLLNLLSVEPLNRSRVLEIAAESENPATAAMIANAFSDLYVEQQLTRKQKVTSQANDWLDGRIEDLQEKTQQSERAVEEYRRENGLYETKSDTVIAQQLAALNVDLVDAESAMVDAQSKLAQATAGQNTATSADSLPSVLQSPLIVSLRSQQATLEGTAARLSSTYTDKHPKVRDINAQIANTKGQIEAEIGKIVSSLRHEAQMASDRYDRISARIEDLKTGMGLSNEKMVRLNELEREAEANRTMLQSLLQRSKETVGQQSLQTSNAEIISRASVPFSPSFPPTTLIVVLAALTGIGCGVLVALLVENLDRTFRSSEEVEEYTGFPTLALVPTIGMRQRSPKHVIEKPMSTFSGSLRTLNTHLALGGTGNDETSQVLMFTSALPGEGKSRISSSFAQLTASEDGKRVILLDLDWRRPSLHRLFNQTPQNGLTNLLSGEISAEQAVYQDPESGVHMMFAGDAAGRNLGHGLWIERLRMLLYTLSRHYDLIVLDAPPAMVAPEVLHLARLVDSTIFVVKWATTPKRIVSRQIRNLCNAQANLAGVVLSQVNARRYQKYGHSDAGYLNHRYFSQDMGSSR